MRIEHALQRAVHTFLRRALPPEAWHTSIDHSNARSVQFAMERKARGVQAGLPDVLILWGGSAIFIELKKPGGVLSETQQCVAEAVIRAGAHWFVADSIEGVQHCLHNVGIPLRAHVLALHGDNPKPRVRRAKRRALDEPIPF